MHLLAVHTCYQYQEWSARQVIKKFEKQASVVHKGRLSSRSNVPGTGHLITYPSNATRYAKNLDVVIVHWSNPLLLQRNRKTEEVCLSCLVIGQRARLVGSSFFFSPFFVSRNSSVQLLITSFRLIHLGIGLLRDCVLFFSFSVDRAGKKGSFLSFLQLLFV